MFLPQKESPYPPNEGIWRAKSLIASTSLFVHFIKENKQTNPAWHKYYNRLMSMEFSRTADVSSKIFKKYDSSVTWK